DIETRVGDGAYGIRGEKDKGERRYQSGDKRQNPPDYGQTMHAGRSQGHKQVAHGLIWLPEEGHRHKIPIHRSGGRHRLWTPERKEVGGEAVFPDEEEDGGYSR